MFEPGKNLGPFRIEEEIGSGAMGTVFRATNTETGKPVAIKVISTGLAANESARARFEREGEILKQLRHPHIVRLFATGHYKKTPFLAMEYVKGEALDIALERRGRLTWEEVVRYGKQLCLALQHAHEKGIIHRDLKPSNLLILKDGTLKLTDFGIAKDADVTALTGANSTVGTAAYMSPEQCRGERTLTLKSDLYSLGIVFYELLTGEKPFNKESPVDMFMAHVNEPVERPSRKVLDIPSWLDTLVCQLLEKKAEHRPLDAAMVSKALDDVLEKVADQKSAGVELATARAVDRPKPAGSDDSDRAAARLLRGASAKKKIRKRGTRIYERGWFTLLSVALLLGGFGWFMVWALGPPSPEKLYSRAKTQIENQNVDRALPILRQFHAHYPSRDDEQARQMHKWLTDLEVAEVENGMFNRFRKNWKVEDEASEITYAAFRAENEGNLVEARRQWQSLADKFNNSKSYDDQKWAWFGEKKISDIEALNQLPTDLQLLWTKPDLKPTSDAQRRAAEALHFELFGDLPAAQNRWEKLREETLKDPDARKYSVLAASHARTLTETAPKGEQAIKDFRLKLVRQRMQDVDSLVSENVPASLRKAHDLCQEIAQLYDNDPNPSVAEVGKKAAERVKDIPRPPAPPS
ncbi:MAG: serine/threonine protein kinase [Gemmataceae bacterium]